MIPLILLVVVTLVARGIGALGVRSVGSWPGALRFGLAVMFFFTAAAHFNSMRQDMVNMVPPWVPDAELAVTLSGIAEILGAVGLLIPATRKAAAIGLILLLISVLPANIHAALEGIPLRGKDPTPLIPRVILQIVFIAAVWWAGVWRAGTRGTVQAGDNSPAAD